MTFATPSPTAPPTAPPTALVVQRADTATEEVLVVAGDVGSAQLGELTSHLVAATNSADHDLLLDARGVTAFDDVCLQALTWARSRARYRGHRVAVLDTGQGPVSRSLRRTGLLSLFAVFTDPAAAAAGLAEDRAVLVREYMPLEPRWRASLPGDEAPPAVTEEQLDALPR